MKLNVRLRECEYVHCSGCGAVHAQSSLPVSSVCGFGVWGAARSHDQKVKRLPLELATRSGTPGRSVGDVGALEKSDGFVQPVC